MKSSFFYLVNETPQFGHILGVPDIDEPQNLQWFLASLK